MSHVRTQIRDATAAALASVGVVSTSRVYPIAEHELPLLIVSTNAETIEGGMMGAYVRQVELVVECVAQGTHVDNDLDALAAAVETQINHATLGGLCRPLALVAFNVVMEAGAVPIGRLRMTYVATYHTAYEAPEVAI